MFVNFCRHRLTIEADLAVSRAKAVASFLSYFITLSIGSVLNPRPPALPSSALLTELILCTIKWALRVYTRTISIKYYDREKFLTIFQDIFKMKVEWHCALISCKGIRSNFFSRSKDVLIDIALSKNKKEDATLKYTDSVCTRCLEDLCWRLWRRKVQAFFKNIYHDTLCCPSKLLRKHCFQFLFGTLINKSYLILPRIQHKDVLLVLRTVFAVGFWLLSFLQLKLGQEYLCR